MGRLTFKYVERLIVMIPGVPYLNEIFTQQPRMTRIDLQQLNPPSIPYDMIPLTSSSGL